MDLTPELMERSPPRCCGCRARQDLRRCAANLDETYCGTIAYEIEHIAGHQAARLAAPAIESGEYRRPLDAAEKRRLLGRLSEVEALESYLHKAFLGQEAVLDRGAGRAGADARRGDRADLRAGAREVVLGMAHRGRLNVLAHTVGRPYESILVEFEGERRWRPTPRRPRAGPAT